MPHPVRNLVFGALAAAGLASCATSSTGSTTLPPMVPSTTAFATLPPVTAPPTTLPGETTTLPPGAPIEYEIKPGDYLLRIAQEHGTTVQDLVTLNGWADDGQLLTPGDKILVPAPPAGGVPTTAPPTGTTVPSTGNAATTTLPADGAATTTTTTAAAGGGESTSTSGAPQGGQEYTVKDSDTVYGIAKKFGITPQALVAANGWADVTHPLYPGDKITVPAAG